MKKNNFYRFLTIFSLLIGILFITTCELLTPGLGDVIDITAPELSILTPAIEPMAYVRSDFTITGTVS
jgi:hypothetical protein